VSNKLNGLEINKICPNKKCGMEIPLMPGLQYCPYCGEKIA